MLQEKTSPTSYSQQTVTLTKNQLRAILQLVTQVNGIDLNNSFASTPEPVVPVVSDIGNPPAMSYAREPLKAVAFSSSFELARSSGRLLDSGYSSRGGTARRRATTSSPLRDRKQAQWVQERSDHEEQEDWLCRFESADDSGARSSLKSIASIPIGGWSSNSEPGTPNRSDPGPMISPPKTAPVQVSPQPQPSPTTFRRYRTISDPTAWETKRQKVLEYQAALAAQQEEREERLRAERHRQQLDDAIFEQKLLEQQERMRSELEEEKRKHRERQEDSERRRQAVIAAIQRTPTSQKRNIRPDSLDIEAVAPVVAVPPRPQQNQATDLAEVAGAATRETSADASVQTDFDLLFRWLYNLKENKDFERFMKSSKEDTNSAPPTAKGPNRVSRRQTMSKSAGPVPRPPSATSSPQSSPSPPPTRKPLKSTSASVTRSRSGQATQPFRRAILVNRGEAMPENQAKITQNRRMQELRRRHLETNRALVTKPKVCLRTAERQEGTPSRVSRSTAGHFFGQFSQEDYHLSLTSSPSPDVLAAANGRVSGQRAQPRPTTPYWRSKSPPVPVVVKQLATGRSLEDTPQTVTHFPAIGGVAPPTSVTCAVRPVPRKKWRSQETFSLAWMMGGGDDQGRGEDVEKLELQAES